MQDNQPGIRCYHFNNFYLAGIHAGIQAGHAQHELARKYLFPVINGEIQISNLKAKMYRDWAENHKTMIVLNAGMAVDLENLVTLFGDIANPYPWVDWRESKEALNGCITSIAMVLPDRIYGWNQLMGRAMSKPGGEDGAYSTQEPGLVVVMKDELAELTISSTGEVVETFTIFEVELMKKMSAMKLFS